MPHRIKELTSAHYPDPLVDYGSTDFILEFSDAAELLQKWRNPQLGRSSREGTILSLASNARASVQAIQSKLLTSSLNAKEEEDYLDQLKVYRFMIDRTLPTALELVNLDQLLTAEDVLDFINQQVQLIGEEHGQLKFARVILNQLNTVTDIEIKDQFGRTKRVSQSDVLDVLGDILGNLLVKQVSMWPVDNVQPRPRGRLHLKKTYKSAIIREGQVPPTSIKTEDIRVIDKDRLSLIYFIVDMSQSMSKQVFAGGLTRLDGTLLTSLGLFFYFRLVNRRKRREFDTFNMHIVPVVKTPYVVTDDNTFEEFLLSAEAKGKTRLVHACYTAMKHAQENYKENQYDVQFVFLTDGRPNVPFEGILPGKEDAKFRKFLFEESESSIPKAAKECMIQLNQLFKFLSNRKDRVWNITYFLMASEKVTRSSFYDDVKKMLSGITRPILIDPTEVDSLGKRILRETIVSGE